MDTLLHTLDLIVRPAMFMLLLGLFYVGVKIVQYEYKLNRIRRKLNNNPMPLYFEEEEFPNESKHSG